MADGSGAVSGGVGRGLYAGFAVFWLIPLAASVAVFDVRPYLTNGWWRAGYHATNLAFGALPFAYAWLALRAG